jgi:hypothetical protein
MVEVQKKIYGKIVLRLLKFLACPFVFVDVVQVASFYFPRSLRCVGL